MRQCITVSGYTAVNSFSGDVEVHVLPFFTITADWYEPDERHKVNQQEMCQKHVL